jgi:hypothetical protein
MRRNSNLRLTPVVVVLACAALLATLVASSRPGARWLADRWYLELETASDDRIAATLDRIGALGEPGLAMQVSALAHPRAAVRAAAERSLHGQLDTWQRFPAEQAQCSLLRLVDLLNEHVRPDDAEALRRAAPLALRALRWPVAGRSGDSTSLTFACEQLIRKARAANVFVPASPRDSAAPSHLAEESPGSGPAPMAQAGSGSMRREGTAWRLTDERDGAGMRIPSGESSPGATQPATLGAPQPAKQPSMPIYAAIRSLSAEKTPDAGAKPGTRWRDGETRSTPPARVSPELLASLTDAEVIRWLARGEHRAMAERELRRRGFGEREMRIVSAATSGDPEVREQLARVLPELSGVDARPWLLLLCRDESAIVRAAAVRWLATSSDPGILELLREISAGETDDSVRQALRQAQAGR